MKLLHLPLLSLAPAASVASFIPDDLAARARDFSETLLASARDRPSIIEETADSGFPYAPDQKSEWGLEALDHVDLLAGDEDDHHEPTLTIFQLISACSHTTKFASHLKEHDDLVQLLNSTEAHHTLFVPTDEAFDHLPFKDKPSDEWIRDALQYHIATGARTAHDLVRSSTVPTVLKEEWLGDKPQRLRTSLNLKGLHINFLSTVKKPNIVSIISPLSLLHDLEHTHHPMSYRQR